MNKSVVFKDLGLIKYQKAWDYQTEIFDKTIAIKTSNRKNEGQGITPEQTENHLVFCEHPHVYTLGKSGDETHLLMNKAQLESNNISFRIFNPYIS